MTNRRKEPSSRNSRIVEDADIKSILIELGQELRRIRRYRDVTLGQVSEAVKVSKARLSCLELGHVGMHATFDTYLRLFAYYGIEIHLVNSEGVAGLKLFKHPDMPIE